MEIKKTFFLACLLHAILLVIILQPRLESSLQPETVMVWVGVWHDAKGLKRSVSSPTLIPPLPERSVGRGAGGEGLERSVPSPAAKNAATSPVNGRGDGMQIRSQILEILHQAIASKQDYPEKALQLNQTGTVTISFNLNPNGALNQIQVVKSSGFITIDQAALAAVDAINPYQAAGRLLNAAEQFKVDIVFE